MNSTSCILLITLLVIVVVGVCMSHPAGKAGMAVGCQAWSDCPPENYCAPFDATNAPVPSGAAGTCVPRCDGPDSCEKKGACQFWRSDLDISNPNLGYCYSTEDQPCGQTCVRSHEIVTGGGKAGFASYPGEHSGPYPFGPNGPTDGKVTNLLTGGQHRTGGKAGFETGPPQKPCLQDSDCASANKSTVMKCMQTADTWEARSNKVCVEKCNPMDPQACFLRGMCDRIDEIDGRERYYCRKSKQIGKDVDCDTCFTFEPGNVN